MTTIAAQAIRTNHRDAGRPESGTWFGRGKVAEGGTPVTIERHGRGITVYNLSGGVVDSFGDTAKFWFIADLDAAKATAAAQVAERDAHYAQADAQYRAEQRAALAGKPAPAWATWVFDEDGNKVGYMSEWGVIYLPAADLEPAAPAGDVETDTLFTLEQLADAGTAGREVAPLTAADLTAAAYALDAPADVEPAPAPRPVVIVPCGSRKRPGLVPAARKYTGPYARSARLAGEAVAARTGALVLTLSARYGLLADDDLVDDYNLTMGDPGAVTAEQVAAQAAALGIADSLVTVLAGAAYADMVTAVWPHAVRPLTGCTSQGAQRARMREIRTGTWAPAAGVVAVPALIPTPVAQDGGVHDDPHAGRGRVEIQPGDVLTVSLVAGVDVSLAWRPTAEAFRPDVDDDGAFRVTVLKGSQHLERARQFHDEATARQHARGMVTAYLTTGERITVTHDTSRRVAATVEPVTSTALEPAGACGTAGRPLDLTQLAPVDLAALVDALGATVNLHDHDVTLWNTSAGKDSMALGVALVALARAQGYPLERIVAVHCDLGRAEWAGTAELAEEHARTLGVTFYRVSRESGDLLEQVRQRFASLQRKADELGAAAAAALEAGDTEAAAELHAKALKKRTAPAWPSSAARWCTSDQKTGQVEKLMTVLAKLWREAGNTDRPIRILNTLGIRAAESPARALKSPLGPDSATNGRRDVVRWLPIFTWSDEQVWAVIRASGLRVHGAYQIGMSRLSCGLCVLSSRGDLVTAARANRPLVDAYAEIEDEVGATFQARTSVREIGAAADELGPLEVPAPAALADVEAAAQGVEPALPADSRNFPPAPGNPSPADVEAHRGELLAVFGATPDLFGALVAAPRNALALSAAAPAPAAAAPTSSSSPAPELHTDTLFALTAEDYPP